MTVGVSRETSATQCVPLSRFHPGMEQRFSFLRVEFFWFPDRKGTQRVMRRTARKKLRALKTHKNPARFWKDYFLPSALRGYYQYYGVRGNSRSLWEFYEEVKKMLLKWLNRHSHRKSYTWEAFKRLLSRLPLVTPRITVSKRLHRSAC